MIDAIDDKARSGSTKTGSHRSPALDAQLEKVRGQLEDWVTCPSSKTPEGKAKIREVTARLDAVKQQVKAADDADAQRKAGSTDAADKRAARSRTFSLSAPTGGYLDVDA